MDLPSGGVTTPLPTHHRIRKKTMLDQSAQEREVRLKTMLVMTGLDHLLELMDEQKLSPSDVHASLQSSTSSSSSSTLSSNSSGQSSLISSEFLGLFQSLLVKFDDIEEKLSSIQTAHFALQHSCSSANEVAQVALTSVQRGNPYLSKIDHILSHQTDHDVTENIICAANEMISVARRDTEAFIHAIQENTAKQSTAQLRATSEEVQNGTSKPSSLLDTVLNHLSSAPQVRLA